MRQNPTTGFYSSTRTTLTLLTVFDTLANTPVDVPLSAASLFNAHTIVIAP